MYMILVLLYAYIVAVGRRSSQTAACVAELISAPQEGLKNTWFAVWTPSWTPKVCRTTAFLAVYSGFGPLFYILWGSRFIVDSKNLKAWNMN